MSLIIINRYKNVVNHEHNNYYVLKNNLIYCYDFIYNYLRINILGFIYLLNLYYYMILIFNVRIQIEVKHF